MKRLKLLLLMAMMLLLCAGVVFYASPYAPVAGGPVEIEELWAIEDARQESEMPLVTALENFGVPLAYDKNENTFYCSIGLENGEEWPELHLTAPRAKGVSICFSDDYTYDYCSDAIAEGYSYELMAYTDTQYSYFYIVFTGLPVVSIHAAEEMTTEDSPIHFAMGVYGEGGMNGPARAHLRGDGSLAWTQKKGYKVEFTRERDGVGKVLRNVPGFGQQDSLLLLPMSFDETLMRDRLSWAMYGKVMPQTESFSAPETRYAEVFVNDEYMGVYLLMPPFNIGNELAKEGSSAVLTDSLYRTGVPSMGKDKPMVVDSGIHAPAYELFYAPDMQRPFAALEAYINLWNEEDDEAFRRKVLDCVDLDSAVRYMMFLEAAGLADNTNNNLYIWAHKENDRMMYRFRPWDMDRSWGIDAGHEFEAWFVIPIMDRIVNLNIGGTREMLATVWEEMKQSGFTYETVEMLVEQYSRELNESGAFMRNTMRWDVEAASAEGQKILNFSNARFPMLDEAVARVNESEEPISFLSQDIRKDALMITPMVVFE